MTEPMSYDIEQASLKLGPKTFTVSWLKSRIQRGEIPFGKSGDGDGRAGRIFFTQRHLERILAQYSHEPNADDPDMQPVRRRRTA